MAFVTNSSFLDTRTFDGFRKCIAQDFSEAWVVNLKGNARRSGEQRRQEGGNIFEDKVKVGVAITILVRRSDKPKFKLHYLSADDYLREEDKRTFIAGCNLTDGNFKIINPTTTGDWLNQNEASSWNTFLPIVAAKLSGSSAERKDPAVFAMSSFGTVSNRDEWVYDYSADTLNKKVRFYIDTYNSTLKSLPIDRSVNINSYFDNRIKWSSDIRSYAKIRKILTVSDKCVIRSIYRPFCKKFYCYSSDLNWSLYKMPDIFPQSGLENRAFFFTDRGGRSHFSTLAADTVGDLHICASSDGFQAVARYCYTKSGERIDNITDWAFNKFVKQYGKKGLTKDAIFHYVYAVLHDPIYRETYALNLKREFPRIPFYPDFAVWAAWGEALMALHIGYEDVAPWPVERIDTPGTRAAGTHCKPILKSQPEAGVVVIDADTQITGIPSEAWAYRLGNRSAIDWVLDQHKEKRPRDPTIAAKFNTYRFADYKESMIALLAKVVRVSIETEAITTAMRAVPREA